MLIFKLIHVTDCFLRNFDAIALVLVQSVRKGAVKKNSTIIVAWTGYKYIGKDDIIGGPSDITVYPGTRTKLFLVLDKKGGYYYATGEWNSAETLKVIKKISLPKKIGYWTSW